MTIEPFDVAIFQTNAWVCRVTDFRPHIFRCMGGKDERGKWRLHVARSLDLEPLVLTKKEKACFLSALRDSIEWRLGFAIASFGLDVVELGGKNGDHPDA